MGRRKGRLKVCIAASVGGHLQELCPLKSILSGYDVFCITFPSQHVTAGVPWRTYHVTNPDVRNPHLGVPAFLKSLKETTAILLRERPDVVITSGATVGVTVAWLSKILLRSKLVYVETMSRINKPSLTGKLLYHISDRFYVQWKQMLRHYGSKAIYGGTLL